jgi:hypothetical protein
MLYSTPRVGDLMLSLLGCTKIVIGRYEDEGYYYTRKAEYITWMYKGTCEEYKYTENKACRKFDKSM